VLHVTETLPGGIATYLRETLPRQITDLDLGEVRVLAPLNQLSHLQGVPDAVLRGYERSGRNLRSLWNLTKELRFQIKEFQPDIVHLHSSFAGAIGRLMRPWLPRNVRIVYCPHGWAFLRDDKPLLRSLYVLAERMLARRADAWVAVSRNELEAAKIRGIASHHGRLIFNGIGDDSLQDVSPPADWDGQYLNLLFVGRHDRQKGLDILLEAMSRLNNPRIRLYAAGEVVSGSAEGGRTANLTNVHWLGWCSPTQLATYYHACDAVVIPSRWEGLPLVAIEAMRAGKALLAARCGGLEEMVQDGVSGRLFPVEGVDELSQLLTSLSSEQLAQWGGAGRKIYLDRYTIGVSSAALFGLYRSLVDN
jgi:glycosyltransferase involved in cell wall biosynthesis